MSRIFNGQTYQGNWTHLTKNGAEEQARRLRNQGWKIRIIKEKRDRGGVMYVLYGHKGR